MKARNGVWLTNKGMKNQGIDCTVGKYSYGDQGSPSVYNFDRPSKLVIGSFCQIAMRVQIFLSGNHRIDRITTFPFASLFEDMGWAKEDDIRPENPVIIGSDVWIGHEAIILPGIMIGHGAVIGARTVVSKDVAPYSVVVGSPQQEVRKRFTDEQIERLLALAWWDKSDEEIIGLMPYLLSFNPDSWIENRNPQLAGLGLARG